MKGIKKNYSQLAEYHKALSNPIRLHILDLLVKEMTVTELSEELEVTKANVSQHLFILRTLGFIKKEKKGYHIYYKAIKRGEKS